MRLLRYVVEVCDPRSGCWLIQALTLLIGTGRCAKNARETVGIVRDPWLPVHIQTTMLTPRHCVDSNDYAEPRAPRRGAHRPEPGTTRSRASFDKQELQKRDNIPTRRHVPYSRHDSRLHVRSEQLVGGLSSTPPRATLTTPTESIAPRIDHSVRSPLELFREVGERTPDRYALEKSIMESYARSAPQSAACQNLQKRCMYPSCTKISVSRGLCRGHGGGRRCHVSECTKSAQSRSNFCWAHGGGQRCEADKCMRSRKSKRFCVAHLHLACDGSEQVEGSIVKPCRRVASSRVIDDSTLKMLPRMLPSLGLALSLASRSLPNLPARCLRQQDNERCLP